MSYRVNQSNPFSDFSEPQPFPAHIDGVEAVDIPADREPVAVPKRVPYQTEILVFARRAQHHTSRKLTPNERYLAVVLATFWDRSQEAAYPSQEGLAEETGLTQQQVSKALLGLQKKGIIRIFYPGFRRPYTLYRFNFEWQEDQIKPKRAARQYPLSEYQKARKKPSGENSAVGEKSNSLHQNDVSPNQNDVRRQDRSISCTYPQKPCQAEAREALDTRSPLGAAGARCQAGAGGEEGQGQAPSSTAPQAWSEYDILPFPKDRYPSLSQEQIKANYQALENYCDRNGWPAEEEIYRLGGLACRAAA